MKIEAGKYYLRADGRKAGPAEYLTDESDYPFNLPYGDGRAFHAYTADGVSCIAEDAARLIAEWTPARDLELTSPYGDNNHPLPDVPATPKTWGEMTDEEKARVPDHILNEPANPLQIPWWEWSDVAKGALLLAAHEGKVIECYQWPNHGWAVVDDPNFDGTSVYRIRPEPKRKTVAISGPTPNYSFTRVGECHDTHRITFHLIDGEPDCASIKMERIK